MVSVLFIPTFFRTFAECKFKIINRKFAISFVCIFFYVLMHNTDAINHFHVATPSVIVSHCDQHA